MCCGGDVVRAGLVGGGRWLDEGCGVSGGVPSHITIII